MRFAVDTGGTFTDLIVEDPASGLHMFKAPTTPADPIRGVLDALAAAAEGLSTTVADLLGRGDMFVYGTTHAINAIVTGTTARTAFLTSAGHPDVLVLREGGRAAPFDFRVPYPEPYLPRSLTWEIPGRILADGRVAVPFDEEAVIGAIAAMKARDVRAVAVCLLWSVVNPEHELAVGRLLDRHMPDVPHTLSHQLNPTLREYRRASSAAIDASLKPMMQAYMRKLAADLRANGYAGRVLAVTSQGGVVEADEVARAPIHLINSGPSMAPVSGRAFADMDEGADTVIIADTGGTTYDVSLVSRGRIPWTRETWIGPPFRGHMTGFPSVDVKSVGAGGGSIAWVDGGGLLHVGPRSAGAVPGPVCYGKGGTLPTVTDAALVLGYIDPDFFLGGAIRLDVAAARAAIRAHVADPLRLSVEDAASAVVEVVTENMVQAIMDITVNQGIDPAKAVLVGGGGAAGLNSVLIARRLGSQRLLVPEVGAALSAAGAMMSDLSAQVHAIRFATTGDFDFAGVNAVLDDLRARARAVIERQGGGSVSQTVTFSVEARYPEQVWEITVPLPVTRFEGPADVRALEQAFHAAHEEIFAIKDPTSRVEVVGWSAQVACRLVENASCVLARTPVRGPTEGRRMVYFPGSGLVPARIRRFEAMGEGERVDGPAVIESTVTAVVINPGASAVRRPSGSLSIEPGQDPRPAPAREGPGPAAPTSAGGRSGVRMAILNNRLEGVARKMANTLLRTGRSGVLNIARDFSCVIVTADNRLLAAAESLPIHVLSGPDLMAAAMKAFHPDLKPGQAFLHNSPYHGCSHPADHTILVPVIDAAGRHRMTVVAKAHQADCGNSQPTTYMGSARDVYEEGALIFPAVKVQEDYRDIEDIVRMCRMRIRVPDQWWGDYLAMMGAARIGERELLALADEVGWDAIEGHTEAFFDYSEQRMIEAVRALPAGRASHSSRHDHFPGTPAEGVEITATVQARPDEALVEVDLTDNPDCMPCGLNLSEACARTSAMIGVFNALDPAVPKNAGAFRRLRIALREGCIVGIPKHPTSCSAATTNIADRVANSVQAALAAIGEGFGLAECGALIPPSVGVISGRLPKTGAPFVNQVFLGCTGGAAGPHCDAWQTICHVGNAGLCFQDSVELDEMRQPIRVYERRFVPDTEGAGRHRGAHSIRVEFGPSGGPLTLGYGSDGTTNGPKGVRGGWSGARAAQAKRTTDGRVEPLPTFAIVDLADGERVTSVSCGGGGYGAPAERDPAAVGRDVAEGWVSAERARAVYRVAVGADGMVDHASTAALRSE